MRSAMEPAEVRAQKAARTGPGSWRQGWLTWRHSASAGALRPSGGVCLCHVGRMSEEAGSTRN